MSKDLLKLTVRGDIESHGRPWEMSFYYAIDTPSTPDADTPADLALGFQSQCMGTTPYDTFLQTLPDAVDIKVIEVTAAKAPGYWPYSTGIIDTNGVRTTSDILPEGIGPLGLIRADEPEAGFRAYTRVYWPAIAEDDQEAGAISNSLVTAIQNFFGSIQQVNPAPLDAHLVVYSVTLDDSRDATLFAVSDHIARIRRRGRGPQGRS